MSLSKPQSDIVYRTPFVYIDRYVYTSEAAQLKEHQLAVTLDDGEPFDLPTDRSYRLSRTHGKNGFGLKTEETIPAGVPVCVLYGEKMLPAEAVGSSFKMVETPSGQMISFEKKAGISYYIKGSCKPTLVLKWLWCGGKEFGVFFTLKITPAGTELSVDYLHILRHDEKNALCDCGAKNCRVGLAAKLPKPKTLCILCPKRVFRNKKEALQHRIVDHIYRGIMPCQYRLCNNWFRSFSGYEKHLRNRHANDFLNEHTGRENYNRYPCPNMCGFIGDRPMETINHMLGCTAVPPSIANRGLPPYIDAQRMMEGTSDEENDEAGEVCVPSPNGSNESIPQVDDGVDCSRRRPCAGAFSPSSPVLGPETSLPLPSPTCSNRSKTPTPSPTCSPRKSPAASCQERISTPSPLSARSNVSSSPSRGRPVVDIPSPARSNNSSSPSPGRLVIVTPPHSSRSSNQSSPIQPTGRTPQRVSPIPQRDCTPPQVSNDVPLNQSPLRPRSNVSPNLPAEPEVRGSPELLLGLALLDAIRDGDAVALYNIHRQVAVDAQRAQGVPEENIVLDEARFRALANQAVSNHSSRHVFSARSPDYCQDVVVPSRKTGKSKVQRRIPDRTSPPVTRNAVRSAVTAPPEIPRRVQMNTGYVPVPMQQVMPTTAKRTEKVIPRSAMATTKSAMRLERVLAEAEQRNLEAERSKRKAVESPEESSPGTMWTTRRTKRSKKGDAEMEDEGMFMESESSNARYLRKVTRRRHPRDGDDDGSGLAC